MPSDRQTNVFGPQRIETPLIHLNAQSVFVSYIHLLR